MLALLAAVGPAGCGIGPGDDRGSAELMVTRDYGREKLVDRSVDGLTESSTALRVLDDSVDIDTSYGGGFVQSIEGLSGGTDGGRRSDWFYSVNGVVAERGAAELPVSDGDRVWWDYRDWTDAMEIGAVVGAFPAPMVGGYDGREWGVAIECRGPGEACLEVRTRLLNAGVEPSEMLLEDWPTVDGANASGLAGGGAIGGGSAGAENGGGGAAGAGASGGGGAAANDAETIRFLVGPWAEVGRTPEGRRLERGPAGSGVFARFEPTIPPAPVGGRQGGQPSGPPAVDHLVGLDDRAEAVQDYGPGAGLVAAMRQGDGPPVWLVTGGSDNAVRRAAALLDESSLEGRYAAVSTGVQTVSLPLS